MFFLVCVLAAIAIRTLFTRQQRLKAQVEHLSAQVRDLSGALSRAGIQLADNAQAANAQAIPSPAQPLRTPQAPVVNVEDPMVVPPQVVPPPPARPPADTDPAVVVTPSPIPNPWNVRRGGPPRPPADRDTARVGPTVHRGGPPRPPADRDTARREPEMSLSDLITAKAPYIVSRLGITLLVIGLALAIGYSWEYFGAGLKIAAGVAGAVALVVGGEAVLRKPDWRWYGQAIIGGGYALAMFVAYAAQNVATVQVMDSPILSAFLLLAISGSAMAHAVFRRSEPLALLATTLALTTISLSPTTSFTFFGMVVILFGLQFVVVSQRWVLSSIVAMLGTYGTFYSLLSNQLVSAGYGQPLLLSYLSWFWLVWTATAFGLFVQLRKAPPSADSLLSRFVKDAELPNVLVAACVVNTVAFLFAAVEIPGLDNLWMVLMALGAAHAVSAYAAWKLDWKLNFNVQTFAALSLVAAGSALKLSYEVLLVVWLVEVLVLTYTGLRTKIAALRFFADALAVVIAANPHLLLEGLAASPQVIFTLGVDVPYNVFVGTIAIAVYFGSARLYRRFGDPGLNETRVARLAFNATGGLALLILTLVETPNLYRPLALAIEGLAAMLLTRRDRQVFVIGLTLVVVGLLGLPFNDKTWLVIAPTAALAFVPRVLYAFNLLRGKRENTFGSGVALLLVDGLALSAVASLLLTTVLKADPAWVTLVLTGEMIGIAVVGLALRDPLLQSFGHVAAAVVGYRLLTLAFWTWGEVIPVVVGYWSMFALNHPAVTKRISVDPDFEEANKRLKIHFEKLRFPTQYWVGGTLLLTAAFFVLASWQLLAIVLAVEGLALMLCGFHLKEKQFFLAGLGVFALLVGKLVFYDLRGAETIWRILSFVVAGAVLMAAAFINARFNKAMAQRQPGQSNDKD